MARDEGQGRGVEWYEKWGEGERPQFWRNFHSFRAREREGKRDEA